ncbi:MAG: malonyl-CoA decarboxylase [Rhodobacteraceae bacterium]|nr:malonyl-CoA decarboxylase [Paracoccaceae bacterium]
MAERSFLSDILRRVAGGGWRGGRGDDNRDVVDLCRDLLSDRGEMSGLVRAQNILDRLDGLGEDEKRDFFQRVAKEFSVDQEALQAAIEGWSPGDTDAARAIHFAAEPKSQELIRRLNRVPGATARLVGLRAALLKSLRELPELGGLDADFRHLFASWFSRGFLEIRRIDWSTPADILEKIIVYEAVHEIEGWDDLRQRVGDPDRRLFAFFHPAMPSEPLIFVEVALTEKIPGSIAPILSAFSERIPPDAASVAVFYSISNCQKGLRGISFGNFLIKQVVAELQRELPNLKQFVTLSPVPGLRSWATGAMQGDEPLLDAATRETLSALEADDRPAPEVAVRLAARYLTRARRSSGTAHDPVAHFHLGNGAILHKVHAEADFGSRGVANSWGVMVNYLYDGPKIEARHQAYATAQKVAASSEVRGLAKN